MIPLASFMDVVGTIGAVWLAVSILLAVAWALGGKRIFRLPPKPPGDRSNVYDIDREGGL